MSGDHTRSSKTMHFREGQLGRCKNEDDGGHVASVGSKAATQKVGKDASAAIWTNVSFIQLGMLLRTSLGIEHTHESLQS